MNVSSTDPSDKRFIRAYRVVLLGLALAWRALLLVVLVLPWEIDMGAIVILAWGLAPYLALAGLAGRIGHRRLLLTSAVLLVGGDLLSGIGVLQGGSSTNAVALITYPFLVLFALVPMTWLVSRFLQR